MATATSSASTQRPRLKQRFETDLKPQLQAELGLRVLASFEHEFQLPGQEPAALPFSLTPTGLINTNKFTASSSK